MQEENRLTEVLPSIRVTSELKEALQFVAANSASRHMSDHIRYAVELYVLEESERMESKSKRRTTHD